MDRKTKEAFASSVPKQKRGHIPKLEWDRGRMKCSCSCGAATKWSRFFGNGAWGYSVMAHREWYIAHTTKGGG